MENKTIIEELKKKVMAMLLQLIRDEHEKQMMDILNMDFNNPKLKGIQ